MGLRSDSVRASVAAAALEQAIARFEESWARGERPNIDDWLVDAGSARRELLIELVHAELECRIKAGEAARVEQYLERYPELSSDDQVVLELIAAEFGLRCRGDAALSRDEYAARFPRFGGALQDRLEARSTDQLPALGRFQLLGVVGRGAFGTVYRARDTQLNRLVALKVPRSGSLVTREDEERFVREARSVAPLRHPGIVPIFEVGGEGTSLPFIVAEFVAGITLAEARTAQSLGVLDAAWITLQIADALDHAHQQGVIHRDVKPSNIMLETVESGSGSVEGQCDSRDRPGSEPRRVASPTFRAKIMDFGLARRQEEITVTLDGQVLGTPGYMSPEQMRGESRHVDGRGDIYSLGVVLYELLTGELPFRGVTRMLREQVLFEQPRPPRRVNDKIPRDLETITLKCMAKEPARRYATAGELAADLRRFLADEPILARPTGSAERLRLWARRNPRVAVLSTMVVLLLVALSLGSAVFAVVVNAARREERFARLTAESARRGAETARDLERVAREQAERAALEARQAERHAAEQSERAENEAETAKEVVRFLASIFTVSDPIGLGGLGLRQSSEQGGALTAAELLRRGSTRIRSDLKEKPAVRAALLDVIGSVYRSLGLYDDAAPLLVEALDIRRRLHDNDHPDVASSLHSLAWLKHDAGDYAAAETMYRDAIAMRQRLLGEHDLGAAATKFNLAWLISERTGYEPRSPDRREESVTLLNEVIKTRRDQLGADHRDVGYAMAGLATVRLAQGKDVEAMAGVAEALRIFQKAEGAEGPGSAFLLVVQARTERIARRFDKSEPLYRQLLDTARHHLGDSHYIVALILADLAGMLREKGDTAAAEATIREAIAIGRKTFGGKHPKMIIALKELAAELANRGEVAEAEQLYREALEIADRWYDANNPEVHTLSHRLFELLHKKRDYDGLEQLCRDSSARPHNAVARHKALAEFLRQVGDLEHAAICDRHVAEAVAAMSSADKPAR